MDDLKQHQQRVVDKLKHNDAVLVYHGMGSGKTYTALSAGKQLNQPINVIGPASIKHNFEKEKLKHKVNTPVATYTYNKPPSYVKGGLTVFDEAHRMGALNTQRSHLVDTLKGNKTLLLTGTPIRNKPSEIIPLMRGLGVNIPRDEKRFDEQFIGHEYQRPGFIDRVFRGIKPGVIPKAKNLDKLKKDLAGKVDYYKPTQEGYPSSSEKDIVVEMSEQQEDAYRMALKQNPTLGYKIKKGIAPSKSESSQMNAFLTATRQISNYPGDYNLSSSIEDAPKIIRASKEIEKRYKSDPLYKGVTYSAYKGHGTEPLAKLLSQKKIPYAQFYGDTKNKDQIIKDYNAGKIKHLLISGAGGEGLDLKGTKLMQILEPHWHNPQLDQVKGRAIRYKSHADLPEKDRNVEIQNYIAIPRERGFIFKHRDKGTDEYLKMIAKQKEDLNNQFLSMLKDVGSK